MKKLMAANVLVGIIVLGAVVYTGTHYVADHYLNSVNEAKACLTKQQQHIVVINGDKIAPRQTQAKLCDTLTITNKDNRLRLIAFGLHDKHQAYDNVTEKLLGKDQSLTITLNRTGTYLFHDHDDETVAGNFTVIE